MSQYDEKLGMRSIATVHSDIINDVTDNNSLLTDLLHESSQTSNFTTPCSEIKISPDDEIFYFYLWNVIAPVLFSVVTVVGIVGNSLVVYVILTTPRMRSVTNLLLLNLAFADILCLLICGPFAAYKYIALDWTFGNTACQVVQYVLYVTVYVTIYTLVVISAQRYFTIVRGHKMKVGLINAQYNSYEMCTHFVFTDCLGNILSTKWCVTCFTYSRISVFNVVQLSLSTSRAELPVGLVTHRVGSGWVGFNKFRTQDENLINAQ